MQVSEKDIQFIVDKVVNAVQEKFNKENEENTISVEASGRHVHLSREHIDMLFGKGYELTVKRKLSQPGQFLTNEKVTLIGPKGTIHKVSVLGPERSKTQIELSKTDALALGIKPPVRESGDIEGSAPIIIATANSVLKLNEGAIAAKRHIHMTPEDAERFNVKDKEVVGIELLSDRSTVFKDVVVRVNSNYSTGIHIDYDEANACSYAKGMRAKIIK